MSVLTQLVVYETKSVSLMRRWWIAAAGIYISLVCVASVGWEKKKRRGVQLIMWSDVFMDRRTAKPPPTRTVE